MREKYFKSLKFKEFSVLWMPLQVFYQSVDGNIIFSDAKFVVEIVNCLLSFRVLSKQKMNSNKHSQIGLKLGYSEWKNNNG